MSIKKLALFLMILLLPTTAWAALLWDQGGTNNTTYSPNSFITSNGSSQFTSTSTNPLYVGSIVATSTTATSTFSGNADVGGVIGIGGAIGAIYIPGQNDAFFGGAGNVGISGNGNVLFGTGAGKKLTTSGGNTIIGKSSGSSLTTSAGANNTLIGSGVGGTLIDGANTNLFAGINTGSGATTATSNVWLGYNAGATFDCNEKVDAFNTIAIGAHTCTTVDNQVVIGNSSITQTLLRNGVSVGGSPRYNLSVTQPTGNVDKGILINGDEYYQTGNTSVDGILLLVGVNRNGNRQLWIGDNTALGSNTNGFFRYQTGNPMPSIDSVTGDGITRLNTNIGSNTSNVAIGFEYGGSTGTTLPASRLTINGNASIGNSYIGTTAPTNGLIVQGNVGIGTTTPQSSLSIALNAVNVSVGSSGCISGFAYINFSMSPTCSNYSFLGGDGNTYLNSAGTIFLRTNNTNRVSVADASGFTVLTVDSSSGGVIRNSTGDLYIDNNNASGNINIRPGGNAQAATFLANGNVGVGTVSPSAKLSVTGSAGFDDLFNISSSTGTTLMSMSYLGNIGINIPPVSGGTKLAVKGVILIDNLDNSGTGTYFTSTGFDAYPADSSYSVTFKNNTSGSATNFTNTSGNFYFSGGNVGIGTSTPGTLLSVASALNVTAATTTFSGTGGINIKNGCFALNNVCIMGIKTPAFNTPATTTWTGTTTEQVLGSPTTSQDILGSACWTDAGTAKIDIYHGTTHLALVSVTTTNTVTSFTSNNSMTALEKFFYKAGTPAGGVNNAHCTLILKPTSN